MINYNYRFPYTAPPRYLWYDAYFIIVNDLFNVLSGSVCEYFIDHFYIDVHEGKFNFFFVEYLCGLSICMIVGSEKNLVIFLMILFCGIFLGI